MRGKSVMSSVSHSPSASGNGTLFLVATPLGNLEDISVRAVNTLKQVDLIAAEDTRRSGILLSHYGIDTKMISCHEHNEKNRTVQILDMLSAGKDIALITDAGTPCVSDPGFFLVRSAWEKHHRVVPIPGPCAAIAALSASGLASDQFLFVGFLPKKHSQRKKVLASLVGQPATMIFYESANRLSSFFEEALAVFSDVTVCLARELTKIHEEFVRGSISEIRENLAARDMVKGECVVLIEGADKKKEISEQELRDLILSRIKAENYGLHTSALARELSGELGIPRKKVYDTIIRLQEGLADLP